MLQIIYIRSGDVLSTKPPADVSALVTDFNKNSFPKNKIKKKNTDIVFFMSSSSG